MTKEDAYLKGIPKEGFLKISLKNQACLESAQRAALIRRGNEFLNEGKIAEAKKIFLTTRYGDGLTRIGDYYKEKQNPLEALRMYWIAHAPRKRDQLVEMFAGVIKTWINEEGLMSNERNATGRDISSQ